MKVLHKALGHFYRLVNTGVWTLATEGAGSLYISIDNFQECIQFILSLKNLEALPVEATYY